MAFEVLPAIDVSRGRLAAYSPRGPEPIEAFGGDPVSAARSYAGAGARWIHVVDMDLAFDGE
ncbi:MAG TPA: HisA/HisF-related TIM barrel protein, partial [Actinomycetota bacterium]